MVMVFFVWFLVGWRWRRDCLGLGGVCSREKAGDWFTGVPWSVLQFLVIMCGSLVGAIGRPAVSSCVVPLVGWRWRGDWLVFVNEG